VSVCVKNGGEAGLPSGRQDAFSRSIRFAAAEHVRFFSKLKYSHGRFIAYGFPPLHIPEKGIRNECIIV
jgi:hypothetical protein